MDKYTASNGAEIERDKDGWIQVDGTDFYEFIDPGAVDALRDFFRTERDEELGRWRWPKNPDYIVYPDEDGDVVVLNEGKGISSSIIIRRDIGIRNPDHPSTKAARAFFDAHPERPAAEAKAGEVWELTMDDGSEHIVFVHADRTTGGRDGLSAGGAYFDIDDASHVTSARKVWGPEVSS